MKKWIFFILLIAVIVFAVVMYRRKKKKETEAKESGSFDGSSTPGSQQTITKENGLGGGTGEIQPSIPIKTANAATITALQKEINAAFELWRKTNVKTPANITVDGKIGNQTKAALQFIYAMGYTFNSGSKTTPEQVTWDVTTVTLAGVRNIIKTNTSNIAQAAQTIQTSGAGGYAWLSWLLPV